MFDMMKAIGKIKELQEKVKEVQENLGRITKTGEAAAGMVKATVNGKRQVVRIEIDESLLKKEDKTTVEDLVVAAMNKALSEIELLIQEEMKKSTSGMVPNIPGMDLNNLFG